jgi:hypothetical protein
MIQRKSDYGFIDIAFDAFPILQSSVTSALQDATSCRELRETPE